MQPPAHARVMPDSPSPLLNAYAGGAGLAAGAVRRQQRRSSEWCERCGVRGSGGCGSGRVRRRRRRRERHACGDGDAARRRLGWAVGPSGGRTATVATPYAAHGTYDSSQ